MYRIALPVTERVYTQVGPMIKLTEAIMLCEEKHWPLEWIETAIETRSYSDWKKAMPE